MANTIPAKPHSLRACLHLANVQHLPFKILNSLLVAEELFRRDRRSGRFEVIFSETDKTA